MKILSALFLLLFVSLTLFSIHSSSVSAQFNPLGTTCNIGEETKDSPACVENTEGQKDARKNENPLIGDSGLIGRAANIISLAAGVVAVIIIIISGFTLVTAGGDSGKVKTARDTIIYAAVGLVVIAVARSIVILVVNSTNN
jgi:hypothetical protein